MMLTCGKCSHWVKGRNTPAFMIPPWCERHNHAQEADEPACREFQHEDYHVCPECEGVGIVEVVWQGISRDAADATDCSMCRGEGYVPREQAEQYDRCKAMRKARVAAGKSLQEAARERGITPRELADIEWGRAPDRN